MPRSIPVSDSRSQSGPVDRHGLWWLLVCVFAAAVVAVARRAAAVLQGRDLFCDDAYYYLVTARNFVESGRFTFDGLSETNGFHPLLFWLEAAGMAVFGTGSGPMSQYVGVCCGMAAAFLLTVGGCLLVVRAATASEDEGVVRCTLLITLCATLVPRFTTPYLSGMESILVLPLLVLVGTAAWRARYTAAGLGALLLSMARLDTLPYVVLPVGLACVWRERKRGWPALGSGLLVVGPALTGTVVLMAWHQGHFGHPIPIHGVLKSCFPRIHFQPHQVFDGQYGRLAVPPALPASLVAVGLLLRSGRVGGEVRGLGLIAAALALIQLAAFVLFQKWSKPIPVWYLGPAMLTGTYALSIAVANVIGLSNLRRLAAVAAVGVLVINLLSVARAQLHRVPDAEQTGGPAEIVAFMKTRPADRIWACTDCGHLAFWSGRSVVNLDGLINDFSYQRALRDLRLAEYLHERKVRYLVLLVWDRPQRDRGTYEPMYACRVAPDVFAGKYDVAELDVVSYQYMVRSDKLRLPRAAEVWRSSAARDGRAQGRAVVFDLDVALGYRNRGQPRRASLQSRVD